jgi:asparagine synthase (glutamine-hydrolysing)
MCGICGFVGNPDPTVLDQMRDALWRRGPDDSGSFHADRVALAHRRLSILDLNGGHQPMSSPDGDLVLVFNGEIYNHPALKRDFEARGRNYLTRSDTETLLHAYEQFGTECLSHFDGMFAFVLYDRRKKLLFGARDRFGEKPLYYTTRPFGDVEFVFASELKSLRQHPAIDSRLQLSEDGLVSYLLHDYVQGPRSIHEGVRRLEPGCAFVYGLPGSESPGFREWQYWQPEIGVPAHPAVGSATPETHLLEILAASVEERLMSDVPVGVLLSGGLDSSTIVALLHRAGHTGFKTFSIGFRDASFDESHHAAAVAEMFGTEHVSRVFEASDLVEQIPFVAARLDEPFADPSILPTSMLCRLAAEHVKVVLGGDGADEIFAGYDPFLALAPARWYRRLVPQFLHQGCVLPLAGCLRDCGKNMSPVFKLSRFLRGVQAPVDRQMALWMGPFDPQGLQRLLPDLGAAVSPAALDAHYAPPPGRAFRSDIDRGLDFFQRSYLPDDILVKLDRASMMHSLEVRAPYLDRELVQFVNQLSGDLKYREGVTKSLLKRAVLQSRLLPKSIVHRQKKGFGIPVARWLRVELHEYFRQTLIEEWPAELAMFDQREIRRLWDAHIRHAANHYKELWALFMLARWATRQRTDPAPPGRSLARR